MNSSTRKPVAVAALSRRKFLKMGAAAGFGLTGFLGANRSLSANESEGISFGIVGDVHYADKDMRINRYYRDSIEKIAQCVQTFNENQLPFAVMLGDFIDKAPEKAVEFEYLKTIRQAFSEYPGHKHFVLGNHDLTKLSKTEYLANCGAVSQQSYYSFEVSGYHFVILDAAYRRDGAAYEAGNYKWTDTCIPVRQQEWLAQDLENANGMKTIVFVHQNLHDESSVYGVKNAEAVRRILEKSGNVLAVMQGHDHRGGYKQINGIHYLTVKALVDGPALENNSYAVATIAKNGRISLSGFGRETDKVFAEEPIRKPHSVMQKASW